MVRRACTLYGEQARGVVAALERAVLGVADVDDVAAGVDCLAQRVDPRVDLDPSLHAGAARGELAEREALFGLSVVLGARGGELGAFRVHHELLGDAVACVVVAAWRGVGVGRDPFVARNVGAGLAVDTADGPFLEHVGPGIVIPLGPHALGGGLGACLKIIGVACPR